MAQIITIENLGKRYTIRHKAPVVGGGYRRLSEEISAAVRSSFRRSASDRSPTKEDFWALRNVSLGVEEGDVLGVIGRNGAGKTTLLKILSRITEPSEGRVTLRGRVASLLEVGTGFHPELTGRENIFLNGAVLGMTRIEISRKFDEIVEFAGVETFLDTPVKRYSSGMYVRLAFAVAAHLDPEILIVDEVLAVGDLEFQRKCLGKMKNVSSSQGRTVLFVSHNMAMIGSLCDRAILLENGRVRTSGATSDVILAYTSGGGEAPYRFDHQRSGRVVGDQHARLLSGEVCDASGTVVPEIRIDQPFSIRMDYVVDHPAGKRFIPNFHFYRGDGSCAFVASFTGAPVATTAGYRAECHVPQNVLNDGLYSVDLALSSFDKGVRVHFNDRSCLMFNVRDPIEGVATRAHGYAGPIPGAVRPDLAWTLSVRPDRTGTRSGGES